MQESLIFFRSFAVLFNAGLPIVESLHLLADSTEEPRAAPVYRDLAQRIMEGASLSQAMAYHPSTFEPYIVGMVKVGESSGTLANILTLLAVQLEKASGVQARLKARLTYPCVLIAGCLLLLLLAPPYLLDGQLRMLTQSGIELPLITRFLLLWSSVMRPPVVLIGGAAIFLLATKMSADDDIRAALGARLRRLPGLGRILRFASSARFARSLAMAIRAGVDLLEALQLSAASTDDRELMAGIQRTKGAIREGASLGEGLSQARFFLGGFAEMVQSGETVGRPEVLLELGADFYEQELELALTALTSLLEPMLLLAIGVLTAFVLTAVLQPTLSLLQTL